MPSRNRANESTNWRSWAYPLALVLAVLAAYSDSFSGVFVLDDESNIVEDETIRDWDLVWQVLPTHTRPFTMITLAANYALGGLDVWGYHAFNVAVHALAALAFFGLARRTLQLPRLQDRFATSADELAFAMALLWAVHPLTTQSVTYIIQRGQSLTGLFAFFTLYAIVRGSTAAVGRTAWYAAAISACLLGMGSKQDAVVIPILAVVYDRIFLTGSWKDLVRRRWLLYLGLAATWMALAPSIRVAFGLNPPAPPLVKVVGSNGKAVARPDLTAPINTTLTRPTAGFVKTQAMPFQYALTQSEVILHYVWLSAVPYSQCFDYSDWPVAESVGAVAPAVALIFMLLGLTAWALWSRPALGFLGFWFFLTLAPSSSIMPIDDVAFEHRMYLPLAALTALAVLGGDALLELLVAHHQLTRTAAQKWGLAAVVLAAAALGLATYTRNTEYQSELQIWQGAANQRPNDRRALHNAANCLAKKEGNYAEAVKYYLRATEIRPYSSAHTLAGDCLLKLGRVREAAHQFEEALRVAERPQPGFIAPPPLGQVRFNLAKALDQLGDVKRAEEQYRELLRLFPTWAPAAHDLGLIYARAGEWEKAAESFRQAVAINPEFVDAHNNLGLVLVRLGRAEQAWPEFERATRLEHGYANGFNNWGVALYNLGRPEEAAVKFQQAVKFKSGKARYRANLAQALNAVGESFEARVIYRQATAIDSSWMAETAQDSWQLATSPKEQLRYPTESVRLAEQTVQATEGRDPRALDVLATAYAAAGRFADAASTARKALQLANEARLERSRPAIRMRLELFEKGKAFRESQ